MTRSNKPDWFMVAPLLAVMIALLGVGCAVRPPAPPKHVSVALPWGAMDLEAVQTGLDSGLERSIEESIQEESVEEFDPDHDGVRTYPLLVLSGGGANGAFGAGFLSGWTVEGRRPDFKVVTGISVGALLATPAFLGPEYDDHLRAVFTQIETRDIYRKRSTFAKVFGDAVFDTWPLQELIVKLIDEKLLAAVAAKHAEGHRLYVGTTNMDTQEFVVWDMGRVASSGRPEALERYRKILLASASIPIMFPPVYFQVEANGETYYEMHADGGTMSQMFFRGFMLDFEDALLDTGMIPLKAKTLLYIIRSGKAFEGQIRRNVNPRTVSIASTTIQNLFKVTTTESLYRIYVLANRYGIDYNLAAIPHDVEFETDSLTFEQGKMKKLFDLGYELAQQGYEWMKAPPRLDRDELFSER